MSTRVNHHKVTPALANALSALSMEVAKTSIDPALKHLIDIRVSQLNGCTFCLDMHSKEAKIAGERELRLYHLAAWRESPLFSAREKAGRAFPAQSWFLPTSTSPDAFPPPAFPAAPATTPRLMAHPSRPSFPQLISFSTSIILFAYEHIN